MPGPIEKLPIPSATARNHGTFRSTALRNVSATNSQSGRKAPVGPTVGSRNSGRGTNASRRVLMALVVRVCDLGEPTAPSCHATPVNLRPSSARCVRGFSPNHLGPAFQDAQHFGHIDLLAVADHRRIWR